MSIQGDLNAGSCSVLSRHGAESNPASRVNVVQRLFDCVGFAKCQHLTSLGQEVVQALFDKRQELVLSDGTLPTGL